MKDDREGEAGAVCPVGRQRCVGRGARCSCLFRCVEMLDDLRPVRCYQLVTSLMVMSLAGAKLAKSPPIGKATID